MNQGMKRLLLSAEIIYFFDLRTVPEVRTGSVHEIAGRFAPEMWKVLIRLWYNRTGIAGPRLQQHTDIGIAA